MPAGKRKSFQRLATQDTLHGSRPNLDDGDRRCPPPPLGFRVKVGAQRYMPENRGRLTKYTCTYVYLCLVSCTYLQYIGVHQTPATIKVYLFLAKKCSERRGSLTQNRWKIRPLSFCIILVVYLGHGIFHPVCTRWAGPDAQNKPISLCPAQFFEFGPEILTRNLEQARRDITWRAQKNKMKIR